MQIDPISLETQPRIEHIASVSPQKSFEASFLERATTRSSMRRMREESEILSTSRESETTSWGTPPSEELIAQFIFALWEERYEDALQIVEQIPPFFPTDPFSDEAEIFGLTSQFFLMKSKCYEELGQMEKALKAMNEGILVIECYGDFAEAIGLERDARRNPGPSGPGRASCLSGCGKVLAAPYRSGESPSLEEGVLQSHWALRIAALLGVLERGEEAIALLRDYQPQTPETVLLYHFLEQKLNTTLLLENRSIPLLPSDEEDIWGRAEALFIAGRYEEAEQLLAVDQTFEFLRASCLVMMGKYDEALALCMETTDESREWDMIYLLCGEPLPRSWEFWDEFDMGFPLQLFLKWELN